MKPLMRRAQLYEDTEKFSEALEDYQSVLNLEPTNSKAHAACSKLPPLIEEKNEKLKEEMIGGCFSVHLMLSTYRVRRSLSVFGATGLECALV